MEEEYKYHSVNRQSATSNQKGMMHAICMYSLSDRVHPLSAWIQCTIIVQLLNASHSPIHNKYKFTEHVAWRVMWSC